METYNILIISIIIFILYLLFTENNIIDTNTKERYNRTRKINNNPDDIINDVLYSDNKILNTDDDNNSFNSLDLNHINPNFINNQYHEDYRDVITALNNISPSQKQIFNIPNAPLLDFREPPVAEVKKMVNDFITVLNNNLYTLVPEYKNKNSGWDELIPEKKVESGWDKAQKSLGLAPSLYHKPKKCAPIKLISITRVLKYETDDEIKYSCDIIMQKINTHDQMVIKVDFIQDKRNLGIEDDFFVSKEIDVKIIIEKIFITGFLSKNGTDSRLLFDGNVDKLYDFNEMEENNLTDPKFVQKILMDKYKQRTEEMQQRNATLDEEGQAFHKTLPHVYDYSNIKGTRTIFDDMNKPKKFY